METPFLGHGYQAFWVEGRHKAELLWQKFGIPSRIGFHFHNLFIEAFVELGSLGVILMLGVMLTACWKSIRLAIRHGLSVEYVYALSMSFMYLSVPLSRWISSARSALALSSILGSFQGWPAFTAKGTLTRVPACNAPSSRKNGIGWAWDRPGSTE